MKKLGIYIHIPFCMKKCNYCDFLSFPPTRVEEYVRALVTEIKEYELKEEYIVDTIFFGGGTPSILSVGELTNIVDSLNKKFKFTDILEFSMEVNPETVDRNKLKDIKCLGVNRLSIGLQSANDDILKNLGRIHTFEKFFNIYKTSREIGYNNINVDIMSALPNQTLNIYEDTLEKIISLKPEHISSYGLIIEEGTKFHELYNEENGSNFIDLPDDDTYISMYKLTKLRLNQEGYHRYEISNYAKKGYECRHNLKYWRRDNYIGFGLGASSCLENIRIKNTSEYNDYLLNKFNRSFEYLDKKDIFNEYIMLGLRTFTGINLRQIYEETGWNIDFDKVKKFEENGYISTDKNRIYLTDKGMEVSSYIISELIK